MRTRVINCLCILLIQMNIALDYYRPQIPLKEGNVFTSVWSDIWWWLLKHVWLAQAGGMHPTGMLSCLQQVFGRSIESKHEYLINYLAKTYDFTRNNGRDFFSVSDNVFVLRY